MPEATLHSAQLWRLGLFALSFALVLSLETVFPRRPLSLQRRQRWPGNLAIIATGTLATRLIVPVAPVALAVWVWNSSGGLWGFSGLRSVLSLPVLIGLSVLALDLVIYLQHVLFHALPGLWRLHRMHHADPDYDSTTALRFHPLEIVLSVLIKLAAVAALGAPPIAVLIFEILLNSSALFNHGNLRLPLLIDRWLRWLIVTPDMHRIHHSIDSNEHHKNFGFCFPWWDRVFGSYAAQPKKGHQEMPLGLPSFRRPQDQSLWALLLQPWQQTSKGGDEPEPPRRR